MRNEAYLETLMQDKCKDKIYPAILQGIAASKTLRNILKFTKSEGGGGGERDVAGSREYISTYRRK